MNRYFFMLLAALIVCSTASTVKYGSLDHKSNEEGLNGSSGFPGKNASLPVQWGSFNIDFINKKVLLKWNTASEFTNKQFIIQRALFASMNFKDIGTVTATDSPNGGSYSFIDDPGSNGSYMYRLIQEDTDGKQTFSKTRSINLTSYEDLEIADNGTSWIIRSNRLTNYSITDMQGRLIEKGSFNGTNIIAKPPFGVIYILTTECNGEIKTRVLKR